MCDNQGCISFAKNSTHRSHTKHIDIQYHYIREKLENQKTCLKYYPTEDMIADALIKPFANDRHQIVTIGLVLEAFEYSQNSGIHLGKLLNIVR